MLNISKKQKEQVNRTFSDNALRMMRKRYLLPLKDGTQEMPADMFERVSDSLALVEKNYKKKEGQIDKIARDFFEIMSSKEFTPAGRTLTNAGGETPLIANCIVLPIHDSMESIFQTLKDAALLQQAGCGLGFDLSEMRPADSPTKTSRGRASGPVSFLKVYDAAFATIKQQCFAKGTLIVTKRGLVPIEEVGRGDETFTEKGWKKVTEVFSNGVRETVRLTLDTGFTIELTPEHKVAVLQQGDITLKRVRDLSREDVLLLKLGDGSHGIKKISLKATSYEKSKYTTFQLQEIDQPEVLDEQLAHLLGWYFADGWNDKQGIGIVVPDRDDVERRATQCIQKLFGARSIVSKVKGENCRKIKINSLWVKRFLEKNGLLKQHSWEISIPEKILLSPSSVQIAFVAGFFDGDGDNGKNYRLNTSSRTFVQQLQLLLLHNGIGAKIKEEQRRANWRIVYRLGIIGKNSTRAFFEKVSVHSWKIQKKEEVKDFGWIFPFNPVQDLDYSWEDIRGLHDGMRNTVSHSALSQIQARILLQKAEFLVRQKVNWTEFLPTKLKSMERAGRQEVYDFEVEDVHMINAGLYTSNSRHGANMAMMRVDHPDVLDFISCKKIEGEIRNFNISVTVTDEFMKALEKNPDALWLCTFKGKKMKPHRVLRHPNGSVYDSQETDITVKQLFDELIEGAWVNGEPGIAFVDTWNKANPLPGLGPLASTNPCGEQTLHPYDNCNLGSINLATFVKNKKVNWARLRFVTRTAVRLLDNVIDKFDFPVPQVTEMAKKNRRIGLGIMGWADMLFQLEVPYNSSKGLKTAEKVMGFINKSAYEMSQELAKEKGVFPNMQKSIFVQKKPVHSNAQKWGIGKKMRNAALTTVAPTGSISMMLDCSSGIEPNFALGYVKQDKDGQQYKYFNRYFEQALSSLKLPKKQKDEVGEEILKTGSIQSISFLPENLRRVFAIAMDISGEYHMKMQAVFQQNVDNSISKTINLPNSATKEEVAQGFMSAWKLGCKSCTVYRDGSRSIQVLNLGTGENIVSTTEAPGAKKTVALKEDEHRIAPRSRPDMMKGNTYRVKTGYGTLYVTVNNDEQGVPFEVFATIGKSGGFFQEQSEGICRLISLALRSGVKLEEVIDNIKGIRGPMPIFTEKGTILSLPDAIGRILEDHIGVMRDVEEVIARPENQEVLPLSSLSVAEKSIANFGFMPGCPDCGAQLQMQEGCMSCKSCGFSRCS